MTDRPTVALSDPVALRAYAHPLRMSLVGLLRREGPLTATQAANLLGESVPNCSFHLRQLAKYGLVERVEGADAREKPWQATALSTSWGRESDDTETRAAVDQLDAVLIRRFYERALAWLARRDADPPQWRAVTGPGDDLAFLTAEELAELSRRIDDLFGEYLPRRTDPSLRPPGARAVHVSYYVTTFEQP
ncbi:winged helix-turn-helix domain-containing protein [Catellatospora sichuanensis]|uniref:winged helix-turn-helix domain-containing protein n=1 Tax=Catellatospora sichuanensis TaxID=1969805 RepID=UPI001183459F|nr:helix-turn-helix domain-containing protein [Catellatospora sichuanensis]